MAIYKYYHKIKKVAFLPKWVHNRRAFSFRSVAQPGRALRSGRRGRWFEPSHSDHKSKPAFMPVFIF